MVYDLMMNTTIVHTNYGFIQGIITVSLLGDVYHRFQGIPYVQPPLGELRFKVNTATFIQKLQKKKKY